MTPVVSRIVKNFKISFKKKFDTEYSEKKSGGRDGQASFIAFIRNVIGQILNVLFPPGFRQSLPFARAISVDRTRELPLAAK